MILIHFPHLILQVVARTSDGILKISYSFEKLSYGHFSLSQKCQAAHLAVDCVYPQMRMGCYRTRDWEMFLTVKTKWITLSLLGRKSNFLSPLLGSWLRPHLGSTTKIWDPKPPKQLRLTCPPESRNEMGAWAFKGRRAIHRRMRRADAW